MQRTPDNYPIFFEVAQGVTNLTSNGVIVSDSGGFYPFPGAGFTATWNRPAGSATGTCTFQLPDPDTGNYYNLQYAFSFTILEYTGSLTYSPGSNTVSAAVSLTQTGNPANTLAGPMIFGKTTNDRFNTLTNRLGLWTNAAMKTLVFTNEWFYRDPRWPTNYAGYVFFADGNPSTADPDYRVWVLSIDDTNDANGNGVPDFSDDPAAVSPPRAPQLALTPGTTNLWLAIRGDAGRTNLIQEIHSLASTNWQTIWTLVPNDPQLISLPLPGGTNTFWRVVAQ